MADRYNSSLISCNKVFPGIYLETNLRQLCYWKWRIKPDKSHRRGSLLCLVYLYTYKGLKIIISFMFIWEDKRWIKNSYSLSSLCFLQCLLFVGAREWGCRLFWKRSHCSPISFGDTVPIRISIVSLNFNWLCFSCLSFKIISMARIVTYYYKKVL